MHPRSSTSWCTCQSYCAMLNRDTRVFERGKMIPRSTRDRHLRDERHRAREITIAEPRMIATERGEDEGQRLDCHLTNIEQEIVLWLQLPVTSSRIPLVFQNDPCTHGEFDWSPEEITCLNYGLYALKAKECSNAAFLTLEYRFCKLAVHLSMLASSEYRDMLWAHLQQELVRLYREKEIHWVQERTPLTPGRVVVNTGQISRLLLHRSANNFYRDPFQTARAIGLHHQGRSACNINHGKYILYPSPSIACAYSWNVRLTFYLGNKEWNSLST